ncbi:MAG: hypothetical protein J6X11_04935 [Treponema sp.]|nr:hypothetical protein [Treponema sp.]MBR4385428.1 hypothetical protein [Treponema sp.]
MKTAKIIPAVKYALAVLVALAMLLQTACSKKQKESSSELDLASLAAATSSGDSKANASTDGATTANSTASESTANASTEQASPSEEDDSDTDSTEPVNESSEILPPQGFDPFALHRSKVGSTCNTFPICRVFGFSKDGKMAYSLEEEVDGRGGTIIQYMIQDLVTDKIVWTTKDDTEDWTGEQDSMATLTTFQISLNNKKAELKSAMQKYGIIQADNEFLQFPTKDGYSCTASIQDKKNGGDDDWLGKIDYQIRVTNPAGKSKTVASAKGEQAYQAVVCGYFKNPYENRLAIIYGIEKYVFEGSGISYFVAGCDLSAESFK